MSPRRKRSGGPGVALALLASALLIFGVHGSSAFAADDDELPKASKPDTSQVEDTDRPKDKSLLARQPADDAVAKKGEDDNVAFYQKWQFWAVTGGIAVGLVAAIWGGITLYHSVNGGDVRPCNTASFIGCYGQGEPQ